MLNEFKSLAQLNSNFKSEADCIKYLENKLWVDGQPTCPICSGHEHYVINDGRYTCKKCRKHYNVKKNTIFDNSNIRLLTWFKAIVIARNARTGISSVQMGKELGITQKSAWFLMMRIREALNVEIPELNNVVEASVTEIKTQYPHKNKNKEVITLKIVGMVERGGYTVLQKNVNTISEIESHVNFSSVIITNKKPVFNTLNFTYPEHEVVGFYPRNTLHLNNVRNRFSIVKKTIHGTHIFVSNKHLNRYCVEIASKQNSIPMDVKKVLRFNNLIN